MILCYFKMIISGRLANECQRDVYKRQVLILGGLQGFGKKTVHFIGCIVGVKKAGKAEAEQDVYKRQEGLQ